MRGSICFAADAVYVGPVPSEDFAMTESAALPGQVRTLGPADSDRYCNHLVRLDPDARRMRFFEDVSEFEDVIEEFRRASSPPKPARKR